MPRSATLDRQGCPAWSGRRIMQFMALAMCAVILDARITCAREWYVSKTGTNANGQSWATAYNHPQDAVDAAFADGGGEVWVKADTYTPTGDGDRSKSFVMRDGVGMYGGFAGTETLRSQRNYATNVTILSGDLNGDDDPSRTLDDPARNNSENSYHVVVGAEGATLDGFTVKAGAAYAGSPNGYGGGVYTNASVTIVNCTFSGNCAGSRGGAIYILDASPTITNCVMSQNSARYGGGIYCVGATSSPTITGCAFSGNTADVSGAGIYVDGPSPPARIADCVFSWNASGANGGGLYADDSALAVVGCTFTGNTAGSGGGAVYDYWSGSSLVVTGCVLSGNTADSGGGIFTAGASPSVTNCTISGNTAARYGGGVYCNSSTALTVSNCIVWGNQAPTGPQLMNGGTPSCTVMNTDIGQSGGFLDGGGNIDSCPLFVDANGPDDIVGTTDDDLRLRAGSPCIDAGWGDNYVSVPSTDLDGNPRHDDTGTPDTGTGTPTFVDMGAFEYQGTTPPAWMTVWAPSAGVAMQPGADAEIRWSSSGSIAGVTIELSRNGGTDWEEIAASTPNDGSHVWTVTDGGQPLPQQSCVVRVSDAADGDPTGLSDVFAVFDGTWYVDVDAPGPVFDGLSWSTAFLHPQQAIVLAETGQEVLVAEGTYLPRALIAIANPRLLSFELAGGVAVYGGYAGYGEPDPDDRDPASHVTVLLGDLGINGDPTDNSYHVVKGASGATLDGFTVTGGNADGSDPEDHGGGMFNLGVTDLTVANCVFADNLADDDGGALFNDDVSGLAISGCLFSGNHSGARGGGIRNSGCLAITITDCEFTENTGSSGGAMYSGGSPIVLTNCLFADNVANGYGGAVYMIGDLNTVFHGCRFLRNTASNGGGAMRNGGDSIEVTNCLFFANDVSSVAGRGGATRNSGILRFTSCTFSGNSADEGGAMYNSGALVTITNCILWGNTAIDGPDIYDSIDSVSTVTWSCVEQAGFAGEGRSFSVDPLFADAAGGDLRLQQGSPCIDAADGDAAPSLDIDGDPRRDDSGMANRGSGAVTFADIGVFEFQGDSTGSRLSLLAPTQAYAFGVGSTLDVNWEATSDISEVKVELSRNGGPWATLVAATANDGEYVWTVDDGGQALPQTDCAVRISDAADGNPNSTSIAFDIYGGIWYVDVDVAGGDGYTWSSALSGLGNALTRARAGDQIWIAEGTYKPTGDGDRYVSFDLLDGASLYGGFPGTPGTEGDFGSRDADVFVTVLSGDIGVEGDSTDNSYHVIVGASNVTLDGFTITGGRAYGGGNRASGAGMYNGLYRTESGVVLTDCVFTGNSASSGGGAVYNSTVDDMTITDCLFTGNSADRGGAIYSYYGSQVIVDCTFSGNSASEHGGAMLIGEISLEITDCILTGNTAVDWGGAIYNNRSPAVVTACVFLGNSADIGGGMFSGACTPVITNCVFSGNSAGYRGGGVANYWSEQTEYVNCSLAGNVAGTEGGGMYNFSASPILTNCVLWSNAAPDGPEIGEIGGRATTVSYSCVGQPGYAGTSGNTDSDPLFVDADGVDDVAGTLDDDLRVETGSPCIDAADGGTAPPTDLAGGLRQDEPGVPNTGVGTPPYADMGAYEFQSAGGESMTVLTPNGGQIWEAGGVEQVTWTSAANPIAEVRVGLSRDGGTSWEYIDGGAPVANAGSFAWGVTGPASAECLVRVGDASDGTPADRSDSPFTVREVMTVAIGQSTITEGDGPLTIGTVSVPTAVTSPLTVALVSDDTTEATVPSEVTILPGLMGVDFDVTATDDGAIDGSQTVTIRASAAAYLSGTDSLLVVDNESQTVTVTLPANAGEGNGTLTDQGQVSIPGTWATDLVIDLASDDTTELTVPVVTTILQGDTSATFDITLEDDALIDGMRTVAVTPTLAGWIGAAGLMNVLDDEPNTITVTLPAQATEGDGTLVGQGSVTVPGVCEAALVVGLASSDETELIVPLTATIPQGDTSVTFDITVGDDGSLDGTQTVTVTGSAAICAPGSTDIDILDDDLTPPDDGGCTPGAANPLVMLLAAGAVIAIVKQRRLVTVTVAKKDRRAEAGRRR